EDRPLGDAHDVLGQVLVLELGRIARERFGERRLTASCGRRRPPGLLLLSESRKSHRACGEAGADLLEKKPALIPCGIHAPLQDKGIPDVKKKMQQVCAGAPLSTKKNKKTAQKPPL